MSTTDIPQRVRTEAVRHCHGQCAYCLSPQALMNVQCEVDHILPEKEGGLTVRQNLALACPLCNACKGARTRGRDARTGRAVPFFHPRRQQWFRHFRWLDDLQTIAGRTRSGRVTVAALHLNNIHLLRLRAIWLAIGSAPPNWQTPPLIGLTR